MEHLVVYVASATRVLDGLMQGPGDYLFVGFAFAFARCHKRPAHEIPALVLPAGCTPNPRVDPDPPPFEERPDP